MTNFNYRYCFHFKLLATISVLLRKRTRLCYENRVFIENADNKGSDQHVHPQINI